MIVTCCPFYLFLPVLGVLRAVHPMLPMCTMHRLCRLCSMCGLCMLCNLYRLCMLCYLCKLGFDGKVLFPPLPCGTPFYGEDPHVQAEGEGYHIILCSSRCIV